MDYKVLVKDVAIDVADDIIERVKAFLAENGRPVIETASVGNGCFSDELVSNTSLRHDQYFEYYSCQVGEGYRLYFFKYFSGPKYMSHRFQYGVLLTIDDQNLAVQLKLML